ncbi:hypothetical protein [Sorangium sp. So ce542]|uniref:hypothetical protein n=1 Tax=Sorangium sp. So ce542 TaxID=3133316 RepID=UPI003F5F37D6
MASRLRTALAAGLVAASIFAVHEAFAEPKDDGLEEQVKACNDNVAYFRSRVDDVVMWSNIFMITGAVISATGSALAGFLNSAGRRKAAAIVGALGALLTVTPKALPDKERLLVSLSSAEKHRLVGTKIRNQFQFARPDEPLVDAQKYVSARFTDCASLEPPQGVPELPSLTPGSVTPVLAPTPVSVSTGGETPVASVPVLPSLPAASPRSSADNGKSERNKFNPAPALTERRFMDSLK